MNIIVLIPAYNPNYRLVEIINNLVSANFNEIIIVNDGSLKETQFFFHQAATFKQVTILEHAVNLGKGAALKFGFNYIYNKAKKSQIPIIGVVTADADGQHLVVDIIKIANALIAHPNNLILGVRIFTGNIPLRSRLGNIVTENIFRILLGIHITDTQTGLRGIPLNLIPNLLPIISNRYEFELDMLVKCAENKIPILQLPIKTIYLNNNTCSHFNPLIDSAKIYMVFFRFIASSLVTAIVDNIIFIISFTLGSSILASQALARSASILVNFTINKKFVFKHKKPYWSAFIKFIILVILMGIVSFSMIQFMVNYLNFTVIPAKILAEILLYLVNFATQRTLIFRKHELNC